MPDNTNEVIFTVIVNNCNVGEARGDSTVMVSFPPSLDGNNHVEFVSRAGCGGTSGKRPFFANQGDELNVTLKYRYKSGGLFGTAEHFYDVDILKIKQGEPPSIEGAKIDPQVIRREAHREVVNGPPGTKYTLSRKRTIERQIVLSESAKLELSTSVRMGFGLLEATAGIKATLAQKDTVLMRDTEEINQSVEVVFDSNGTTTLQWVDYIKRGKAQYKIFGKTKELEFEVLYSSELTIVKK